MGSCKFSNELNRLRKSSSDSIDNVEKFDRFKEYMHVTRTAEEDLKDILRKVNAYGKKTLVLLCGSAGDGKSHLLSYLKNSDEEHLIQNYVVYNDATESSAPSKTAIETMNDLLFSFKDSNMNNPGQNIILAINLGVLSNFIESEYGREYSQLRNYVEHSNILTTQVNNNAFDQESCFQHVSFSDYHMFSLTEEGVHAGYIEAILDKVFCKKDENLFYRSYINDCSGCPLSQKCPVKKNYEYMMDMNRQKYVAELLVETIIQDKVILTTREILNFIYDILIAQNFSFTNFQKLLIDDSAYLKEFIKQITPALLFDSVDVTILMNMLKKYDPLLNRSEKADEIAISYYVSSDVSKEIINTFANVSYKEIICDSTMIAKINDDKMLKSNLFNLIVRIQAIDKGDLGNEVYKKYLSDLYMFNAGKGKKLGSLYNMVEKGVAQWCGCDEDGNLCLDDKHPGFSLYEKIHFKENLDHIPYPVATDELQRFVPAVATAFKDSDGERILLDIDFSLYELIYRLNHGYIQTADDRNNHADFISFVNRILQTGSLTETVSIVSKEGKKAIISQGMFGYKFKVVK
ncbi:MAG: DNA phosphorothioation-dependent restriction protein DptF [Lachnospiraceae bacterium]|nr:DNA phosphorothioation-dependent restriction protein DptF [Lachnospiraceae bacterium]